MQGFIISLHKVREEDLIVTIISHTSLETLYRFYGARHGTINIGFKIDFEIEKSAKSTIDRLKDVIHIGYPWINNRNLLHTWQEFIQLFSKHLKDAEEIGEFYFNLIESASKEWSKQNPKRVAIESYIKLLKHEGRLHQERVCFLCSRVINDDISLIRAFLPIHKNCSYRYSIKNDRLAHLYKENSTLFLDDEDIEVLWKTLLEGF